LIILVKARKHEIVRLSRLRSPDIGARKRLIDGTETATLLVPDVPLDRVQDIGKVCALTILATLDWPEEDAAAMARRVTDHLAEEPRQVRRADTSDLDDGIPF
jgi:hypothetical protein